MEAITIWQKKNRGESMAYISFENAKLIEELKQDIAEFGGETVVAVWCREYESATVYTNYDFIHEENPIQESELEANEHIEKMTMTALLILLENQNKVL